jgi:PAS domain S-box-containing protein
MAPIKVLVASDSILFTRALSDMISAEGHEVILTRDEQEVVSHLSKKDVDLCLIRDSLPDALDICERFSRNSAAESAIPVIIFSPHSNIENGVLKRGAAGFLKVPCQPEAVQGLVERWAKLTHYRPIERAKAPTPTPTAPQGAAQDSPAVSSAAELSPEAPLVLLVDDSKLIHTAVGQILRDNDFRVVDAYDGVEGWEQAREWRPDLIISDIDMPRLDGYGMCRKVKEAEETQHIPVIILSARSGGIDIDRGFDAGANDFLTKPIEANELLSRIQMILTRDEIQPREKVLVVDDSKLNRNFVSQGLSQQGFVVMTATNGQEALEQAIQHEPDLVITDLDMPVMNGRELCRQLKRLDALKDLPIIMLTGSGSVVDRLKGTHAGVDVYLSKPFALDKLLVLVEKLVAERRLLKENERRLRLMVEAMPTPVLVCRATGGEIVYANALAGPLMGLSARGLLGRTLSDFFADPAEQPALLAALEREGEVNHREIQVRQVDGTPLWAEVSLRHLAFDDKPGILITFHDVTERKRAFSASVRFVPVEFLNFFQKGSLIDLELGDHISDKMTVMFSDVRSFTTISEGMTPQDNFGFVNAYLGRVSPVIRDHRGFIVKYLGDGMMAVFPHSADDAVQAGIEKLRRVAEYNERRKQKGYLPIAVGIGVNTGHMMVGMVGEANRMQGDAFSDDVNLTARVEGLTKHYSVSFIITAETYQRLADPSRYRIRFLDKVQVKGKTKPLQLHEVYETDSSQQRTLKQETQADYDEAMRLLYARKFTEAQSLLFKVLQRNPGDRVAWHHLVQATQLVNGGVAEDWTGVTVMTTK